MFLRSTTPAGAGEGADLVAGCSSYRLLLPGVPKRLRLTPPPWYSHCAPAPVIRGGRVRLGPDFSPRSDSRTFGLPGGGPRVRFGPRIRTGPIPTRTGPIRTPGLHLFLTIFGLFPDADSDPFSDFRTSCFRTISRLFPDYFRTGFGLFSGLLF